MNVVRPKSIILYYGGEKRKEKNKEVKERICFFTNKHIFPSKGVLTIMVERKKSERDIE
jgi:hypothetical protein